MLESYSINKTFMASYSINRTLVNLISREFRQDRKLTEGQGYGCLINVTQKPYLSYINQRQKNFPKNNVINFVWPSTTQRQQKLNSQHTSPKLDNWF